MTINDFNQPVASNVVKIIDERGLKQKAVAEKAGFSVQGFNDMLNGRKIIKICDVNRIAVALGVPPNELYCTEQNKAG